MNNIATGAMGELYAARMLRDNGYVIIASNYKTKVGEIDIIAEDKRNICFIEVKTRAVGGMLPPSSAVDSRKRECIKGSAALFLNNIKHGKKEVRYDIIEIIVDGKNVVDSNHIKNAF